MYSILRAVCLLFTTPWKAFNTHPNKDVQKKPTEMCTRWQNLKWREMSLGDKCNGYIRSTCVNPVTFKTFIKIVMTINHRKINSTKLLHFGGHQDNVNNKNDALTNSWSVKLLTIITGTAIENCYLKFVMLIYFFFSDINCRRYLPFEDSSKALKVAVCFVIEARPITKPTVTPSIAIYRREMIWLVLVCCSVISVQSFFEIVYIRINVRKTNKR